uniref:Uncharacterized protein n=1 Tax=Meloidogyne enterolobii TaxID=390850 RepID=A0A6V7XGC7_MELEN|nr:unnamed protein product [Meloidogyne enterolobii]
MNSKSDWLQKIGEYQNKLEEYQKVVFCEEKLWFFGQKCLLSLGNYVTFNGPHSDYFDTITNTWGGPKQLEAISSKQHFGELIFVSDSEIFLLLFSHFGTMCFYSLHQFNKNKRCWELFFEFEENNNFVPSEESYRNDLIFAGELKENENKLLYFVSYENHN